MRDGIAFSAGAEVPKQPSKEGINEAEGLHAPVLQSADLGQQAYDNRRRGSGRGSARKKKPSREGEKIIVVDPVTGKKKVKKRVKKGTARPAGGSSGRKKRPSQSGRSSGSRGSSS
eukprot:SAG31_NODE_24643_length_477_cov_0.822751_1_plen_115_part_10